MPRKSVYCFAQKHQLRQELDFAKQFSETRHLQQQDTHVIVREPVATPAAPVEEKDSMFSTFSRGKPTLRVRRSDIARARLELMLRQVPFGESIKFFVYEQTQRSERQRQRYGGVYYPSSSDDDQDSDDDDDESAIKQTPPLEFEMVHLCFTRISNLPNDHEDYENMEDDEIGPCRTRWSILLTQPEQYACRGNPNDRRPWKNLTSCIRQTMGEFFFDGGNFLNHTAYARDCSGFLRSVLPHRRGYRFLLGDASSTNTLIEQYVLWDSLDLNRIDVVDADQDFAIVARIERAPEEQAAIDADADALTQAIEEGNYY